MAFAGRAFIGLVRTLRRVGSVGVFCAGLLLGAGAIGFLNNEANVTQHSGERFSTPRADASPTPVQNGPDSERPWSRVLGGQQFEKVTDVAVLNDQDIAFAGLSLGVGESSLAHAILVRTGPEGYVHGQVRFEDPRLGSVSRVRLDDAGRARIIHWVDAQPAFAMADLSGDIIWSRVFEDIAAASWADISAAESGHTLVAFVEAPVEGVSDGRSTILRLDESGKVAWRHELDLPYRVEAVRLAGSGDGGALVAVQVGGAGQQHALALLRLDRRGRLAWQRPITSGTGISLADTILRADGAIMLVAGAPSSLFRFDGLGELAWVRDLPALDPDARHVVQESETGDIYIIAEPRTSNGQRRHWLAQYTSDGRQEWTHTRVNRLNATLETAAMAPDGRLLAGGSLVASARGDTDMLMLQLGPEGRFPRGLDGEAADWEAPVMARNGVDRPSAPILAASFVLEETSGLDFSAPTPATALSAFGENESAVQDEVREVSAPLDLAALAQPRGEIIAPFAPLPAGQAETDAISALAETAGAEVESAASRPSSVETLATPPVQVPLTERDVAEASRALVPDTAVEPSNEAIPEIQPVSYAPQVPTPRNGDPAYAYQCTYTCLAQSDDVVKYPVSRVFSNISESNGALVSLDMMAMDRGVCLETGGRVYDQPRLPPICERVN